MIRFFLAIGAMWLLCSATPHHTTAFIGSQGDLEILPSYSYYSTKSFWNSKGHRLSAYDKFCQDSGNLYLEYALNTSNSLFAEGAYIRVSEKLNHNCKNFEDPKVGWKHQFFLEDKSAFTGQLTFVIPLGKEKCSIRYDQFGIEYDLIYSNLFELWTHTGWYDLSLGYLYFSGYPSDQLRAKAALGYEVFPHFYVVAATNVDYGFDLCTQSFKSNYILLNPGYRLVEGQVEFRWEILKGGWLIFGLYQNLFGKCVGTSGGGFGGAWITF